ncbi:hypothetical protein GWK47_014480 [Chionoecetes opilio]|uniref:Uncharacterized protein n=1 Tax=Chionoecetes opilio TaxID=41210 RepID=A0A8J5CKI1_CHIOP|nr:hypothetical protein GWK47_014480 [Chionoecetes opilio]
MSGKRTVEDFFRVEASSSDVTQERERNISGSSGSVDIPTISRSSSLISLGSEPEDSRPGSQASDQVDVVIAGGCSISSQELQTIKDKMAALTNYYKLSHVIKSKNAPDTSSKVLGKTIKVYNLRHKPPRPPQARRRNPITVPYLLASSTLRLSTVAASFCSVPVTPHKRTTVHRRRQRRLTSHRHTTVPPYVPGDVSPQAPPFPFVGDSHRRQPAREVFL